MRRQRHFGCTDTWPPLAEGQGVGVAVFRMNYAADIWAAVPVKEFAGAKQRLAPLLTPEQRQALAKAMLEDVLAALVDSPIAGIMVNTLDPVAGELARRYGARVVTDGARDGHTGAVAAMARILGAEGHVGMLALPGDIPRVTSAEIATIINARHPAPSLTIVPAHDERGSNAVLCSPPMVMPLRFGDDSFLPHLAAARALGLEPTVVKLHGIALDIDQPQDVTAFRDATPPIKTRTAMLLEAYGKT
jgi:2-phospho-L-lactate/phosphoenolpyruvate guanylyltransferase